MNLTHRHAIQKLVQEGTEKEEEIFLMLPVGGLEFEGEVVGGDGDGFKGGDGGGDEDGLEWTGGWAKNGDGDGDGF